MPLTNLPREEVCRQLERIEALGADATVVDAHVHPFEVFLGESRYSPDPALAGVHATSATPYRPPDVAPMKEAAVPTRPVDAALQAKLFMLTVRRLYAHTGPRVLGDQMALAQVDRALLLPVAGADSPDPFPAMAAMYGGDPRFALGYCVPPSLEDGGIAGAVADAVEGHGAVAIKVHPAITGIPLDEDSGIRRLEHILDASRASGVSVVVHGGLSPQCKDTDAVAHGDLSRLRNVDWGITDQPVVIAHAGAFGHSLGEVIDGVLPRLSRLMARHDHLMTDLSGLDSTTLAVVLGRLDLDRVVFGSDALYFAPWEAMVRLALALEDAVPDVEDAFLKIASLNPLRLLGEEG
jgi:predicted TIM-barrel fold metal-dependent hydrolase